MQNYRSSRRKNRRTSSRTFNSKSFFSQFQNFFQSFKTTILKRKSLAVSVSVISLILISSFVYNANANKVVPLTTVTSEPTNEQTQTIVEKIYVKDTESVSFNYEESSIKIKDGKLQCIEDDRILQWHKGENEWECRKPTHSVFGKLDRNHVEINSAGSLECEDDGDILFWDGKDDQWSCRAEDKTTINAGKGLNKTGDELSINAPTCEGADKLQWDGNNFICSEDQRNFSHANLTDLDSSGHPADVITYDNTTSGLTATETQSAIDELASTPSGYWDRDSDNGYVYPSTAGDDVTVRQAGVNFIPVENASTACTATLGGGGAITGTNVKYTVTFINESGETSFGGEYSNTLSPTNQQIDLTNIPVSSDETVIARKIYRASANTLNVYALLVGTINDNTTTTFTDNTPAFSGLYDALWVPSVNTTAGIFDGVSNFVLGPTEITATSSYWDGTKNVGHHLSLLNSETVGHAFLVDDGKLEITTRDKRTNSITIGGNQNSDTELLFSGAGYRGGISTDGGYNLDINSSSSYGKVRIQNDSPKDLELVTGGGSLGINETTPTAKAHIKGSGNTSLTYTLKVDDSDGDTNFSVRDDGASEFVGNLTANNFFIRDNTNTQQGVVGMEANNNLNYRSGASTGSVYLGLSNTSNTAGSVVLQTSGVNRFLLSSAGNIGIGTTDPKAKLDVDGGVKIADDIDDCDSFDKAGTLRYRSDANNSYVEMCMQDGANSYDWETINTKSW